MITIKDIEQLISQDKPIEAIQILESLGIDKFSPELISYSARFNRNEKNFNLSLISFGDHSMAYSRITTAITCTAKQMFEYMEDRGIKQPTQTTNLKTENKTQTTMNPSLTQIISYLSIMREITVSSGNMEQKQLLEEIKNELIVFINDYFFDNTIKSRTSDWNERLILIDGALQDQSEKTIDEIRQELNRIVNIPKPLKREVRALLGSLKNSGKAIASLLKFYENIEDYTPNSTLLVSMLKTELFAQRGKL